MLRQYARHTKQCLLSYHQFRLLSTRQPFMKQKKTQHLHSSFNRESHEEPERQPVKKFQIPFSPIETRSKEQELSQLMQKLNSKIPLDYQAEDRRKKGTQTEQEIEKDEKARKEIQAMMEKAEAARKPINFSHPSAMKLMESTSSSDLNELGVRLYAGSRDIPQDVQTAYTLLIQAQRSAVSEAGLDKQDLVVGDLIQEAMKLKTWQDSHFYVLAINLAIIRLADQQMQSRAQYERKEYERDEKLAADWQDRYAQLQELALVQKNPHACFYYGKETYQDLVDGKFDQEGPEKKAEIFELAFRCFEIAANNGIVSSMWYLSHIHLDGRFMDYDANKAFSFLLEGAAHNNAMCFYDLSRVYSGVQDIVNDIEGEEMSKELQFLYLKRAAEEGYVRAQLLVGLAYKEGELVQENKERALSWFREAARNGEPSAYALAGDILNTGCEAIPRNRLFAMINYLGAYENGFVDARNKIEELRKEIVELDGFRLPQILYYDTEEPEEPQQPQTQS